MTTPLPPGWYPSPDGKPEKLYWDGHQWHSAPPPPPPPPRPAAMSNKTIGLGLLGVFAIVIAISVGNRINGDEAVTAGGKTSQTATRTPVTNTPSATRTATATDAEIAAAAEQLVRDNWYETPEDFGTPYEGSFAMFTCRDQLLESNPENCWVPFLNGFSFDNGTLSVVLQVDRTDLFSQLQAERAAIWFRNFISADFHGILKPNVDQVVITDGTGTVMARQQALKR